MKKIKSYNVIDGEKILERVAVISDSGKILNRKLYEAGKLSSETRFQYDDKDNLTQEDAILVEGGSTTNKYSYNDDGEILKIQRFLQGELFEEEKYEYGEEGTIKTVWQDSELIEKLIETENEDGSEEIKVYDKDDKLTKTQKTLPYEDQTEVCVYDADNKLMAKSIEVFNDADYMVARRELDGDGHLLRVDDFTVENGLILKHHLKTKVENEIIELETHYKYDENEKEIEKEMKDMSGNVLQLQKKTYNEDGELVEDIFENLSGNLQYGASYHHIIEIEKVET